MKSIRLSIVVPVYNVESFLETCINSIIGQITEQDEIILVEDCSTDSSSKLCEELASKHKQILLVRHDHNKGLSEARNSGIKVAKGQYITFVDSDDYIEPGTYTENLKIIEQNSQIDILEYPVSVHHLSDKCYNYIPGNNQLETYKEWLMRKGYRHSYAWNKIFRRTLWEGTEFPAGKHVEDLYTIPYIAEKAHNIFASNKGIYYYCKRESSICKRADLPFYYDHLKASATLFQHVKEKNILSKRHIDILYCEVSDTQVVFKQNGGEELILPPHTISASSIFHATTKPQYTKMALIFLLRNKYTTAMAWIRKRIIK